MFDPIKPPAARRPEEALELVSQALSDGDLEAALAQYEKSALLACWPEMALTCLLERSGRPEIRRLVTMRAAERPRTARRSTARATATRRDTPAPARLGSGRADGVGFGVGR